MESFILGITMTFPVTPFLEVLGLQANWVPLRDWNRGWIKSIWVIPLLHPFQVPHCSNSAGIPHWV